MDARQPAQSTFNAEAKVAMRAWPIRSSAFNLGFLWPFVFAFRFLRRLAPAFPFLCPFASPAAQAGDADPPRVHYQPRDIQIPKSAAFITSGGAIAVVGYNDMRDMLEEMVRLFVAAHPGARFELDLRGTRFAPAALAAGTSAFAPMGGEFTPQQLDEYRAVAGADPILFRVAHASLNPRALSGPLAIFVHRENPLRSLTLEQAAGAFTGQAAHWSALGATGAWADRPIHPYGLKPETVLGIFAQNKVLGGRAFGRELVGFPQSVDVVEKVSNDSLGIGFAAANRASPSVRALALAPGAKDEPVAATAENIVAGRYPLDRFLLIYTRRPVMPLAREFLRLVLSREGQQVVAASPQGYLPLSPAEAAAERAKLE